MPAFRHPFSVPFVRRLLAGGLLAVAVSASAAPGLVLTNAAQVRALSPEAAAKKIPVRLRGGVLADPAGGGALVVYDGTEAIYASGSSTQVSKFRRGDAIELTGVTDPGGYAPIVLIQSSKKTGTTPLPEPLTVNYDDLTRKQFDAQFVEISGVVRSCEPAPDTNDLRSKMVIATGGTKLAVRFHTRLPTDSYVDAEVRLRGICFSRYTASRQFLSPMLDIPRDVSVLVEKPAPENPWAAPLLSVADLLKFSPQRDHGHRVRVRGVVTYYNRHDGALWLRDGKKGLLVLADQAASLQPGDEIEVLGFPFRGVYAPIIEDAIFKPLTRSATPLPTLVTNLTDAVHQDADLIQLDARLESRRPVQDGWALTLDWRGTIVDAQIKLTNSAILADWLPGSRVRVAGICSAMAAPNNAALSGIWEPKAFNLLLRSPADLVILQPPPWWNHERVLTLMIILVGLSLAVTATAMLVVRLRLREQSRRRALAEAEFAAILAERNRLAREIHDTLAQGLTATSVQLRLAKKDSASGSARLAERLDEAQSLVRASLDEARKSIWNMRSQVLETGDLATALEGILKQLTKDTGSAARFEVTGKIRRLSPAIENNLLRAGQEAITNAAKHGRAKTISVRLDFAEKYFALTVRDDGGGFDPAQPPPSAGGFGLVGMRERAELVHGELTVRSTPGQGTEIGLRVPLTGE